MPGIDKKLVGFCRTSDFSCPNFVGVGSDWILMLIYRIWSLEKHSPLISAVELDRLRPSQLN